MTTTRARASKKAASDSSNLLSAIKFISRVQKETGNVTETHCVLYQGWAVATNNIMTLGTKIVDELDACPQTTRLLQALARCGPEVAITQVDSSALSIKSGPLRVKVPCVTRDEMALTWADPVIAPMDKRFTDALLTIQHLANENADKVQFASILCRNFNVAATTGLVIAETWHGIETPPQWVLPKVACAVLTSIDKTLVGFGFSGRSATFHFEDGSWFKTQLYEDQWPNIDSVFAAAKHLKPAPSKLFEALEIVTPLVEDNKIKFSNGALTNGDNLNYEVPDLKEGPYFNPRQLLSVAGIFKTYDDDPAFRAVMFFGGNSHGAIAKMKEDMPSPPAPPAAPLKTNDAYADLDDDIPF